MIHIVDSIMGSGKTSAAINYINEHPEKKYLFITPFINETLRIQKSCPAADFWVPSNLMKSNGFRKIEHFRELVRDGKSVALTHALFREVEDEIAEMIINGGYVVFIDEVIDVLEPLTISRGDYQALTGSQLLISEKIGDSNFEYIVPNKDVEYAGGKHNDIFRIASKGRIIAENEEGHKKISIFFWSLSRELFTLSDEVYVLTYLFDGMPMKAFLQMNDIEYDFLGVRKCEDGAYRFSAEKTMPEYIANLRGKLHIIEDDKINDIGKKRTALSSAWTDRACINGDIDILRKNLSTFFRRRAQESEPSQRLWTTYKKAVSKVRDKGFYRANISCTTLATNDYRECTALAYCVNMFINPFIANYFIANNASVDAEKYALANMLQWIWRGCIRDGKEMKLYVPSSRMREMLYAWINQVEREYREGVDK